MTTRSLSRRTLPAWLAAVLVIATGALIGMPAAAHAADDDVTWTVRTASNDLGADRTNFAYTINPGATLTDGIVITNRGQEALDLGVYAADGYTTDSGQFDLLVAGEKSTRAGAWVVMKDDRVAVAPAPALLPGESWTQTVSVADVAPLVLLTGTASVVPLVTDAAGSTSPAATVTATGSGWAVPWTLLVIVLLIAAAIVVWPRVARRRRDAQQAREDARVQEAVERALQDADASADAAADAESPAH